MEAAAAIARCVKNVSVLRLAASARAAISRASVTFIASGFSQMTCSSASRAARTCGWCKEFGVATTRASRPPLAIISRQSVNVLGTRYLAASAASRSGFRPQRETSSTSRRARIPGKCSRSAHQLVPITPTRKGASPISCLQSSQRSRQIPLPYGGRVIVQPPLPAASVAPGSASRTSAVVPGAVRACVAVPAPRLWAASTVSPAAVRR